MKTIKTLKEIVVDVIVGLLAPMKNELETAIGNENLDFIHKRVEPIPEKYQQIQAPNNTTIHNLYPDLLIIILKLSMNNMTKREFNDLRLVSRYWRACIELIYFNQCIYQHKKNHYSPQYTQMEIRSITTFIKYYDNVKEIRLINYRISKELFIVLLRFAPNLASISMKRCFGLHNKLFSFMGFIYGPQLTSINISGSWISDVSFECIIKHSVNLKRFRVACPESKIKSSSVKLFGAKIKEVSLSIRCENTDLLIWNLATGNGRNITSLDLNIDDFSSVDWCQHIPKFKNLIILCLRFSTKNSISMIGFKTLTTLESLTLDQTRGDSLLTDANISAFTENNPQLRKIQILHRRGTNLITNRSVISVIENCKQLKTMSIMGAKRINDNSLFYLSQCTSVSNINLTGLLEITDVGIEYLLRDLWQLKNLSVGSCPLVSDRTIQNCLQHSLIWKRKLLHLYIESRKSFERRDYNISSNFKLTICDYIPHLENLFKINV